MAIRAIRGLCGIGVLHVMANTAQLIGDWERITVAVPEVGSLPLPAIKYLIKMK